MNDELEKAYAKWRPLCEKASAVELHVISDLIFASEEHDKPAKPRVPRSIGEVMVRKGEDPDELIRNRFLCRGAGLLLAAPTGVGKSTLALQLMLCFAVGRECFGFKPSKPLRSLYIQAENDDGDLAELRDGIFYGLRFTAKERQQATTNVHFATVDDATGAEFIWSVLEPLTVEIKPDLLWIDPLFAYVQGSVSNQETVSPWLRTQLTPLLRSQNVGCILIHHTNKPPSGAAKPNWQAGDFAYLGSGSAELANWPRAVVGIRNVGSHDVFELCLGKRGGRLGWKNTEGQTIYARFIAHGADGIYWREVEAEAVPKAGRPSQFDDSEILDLLPAEGLSLSDWLERCKKECGVSESTFQRSRRRLVKAEQISKCRESGKWIPAKSEGARRNKA